MVNTFATRDPQVLRERQDQLGVEHLDGGLLDGSGEQLANGVGGGFGAAGVTEMGDDGEFQLPR